MLPSGHIAAGVLLGAQRSQRSERHPGIIIAGGIVGTCLPDVDLMFPALLDLVGVDHRLSGGEHHSWPTHTPLFWAVAAASAGRIARRPSSPAWAPEAANLLGLGVAVHLLQDSVANTVALLWPLRRRRYGLGPDRLRGVTGHLDYMRRYPSSPAGKLEGALVLAAAAVCWRQLVQARRR